ncbi:hypothetical protein GIB67_000464 [Kingdonia uniflora]|uniref:Uncharacterized protein n=1 Tax=Kingdonia uniflora TaxID=39325 RepID=A0A7J7L0A3_9MAGN|nr:hypothetical protein GIB67_000464 [Kingdonia uniflora]
MLGWMKSMNPEINGVTGNETNPVSTPNSNSARVYFKNKSEYVDLYPGHSFQAVYERVYSVKWDGSPPTNNVPTMEGFAQQAENTQAGLSETVMNGFRLEFVPIYKELGQEFAVFDRWFASLPTETQPNRLFIHSATSNGSNSNERKKMIEGYAPRRRYSSRWMKLISRSGFIIRPYPP